MIKKIVLYIFFLLLILFGLQVVYNFSLSKNPNIKSSYVLNNKVNADVLFLGPCEPLWMLDPDSIDPLINLKTFNLATNHSNFAENYLHLYLYLKNNPAPKYIFQYITTESVDGEFNVFNSYLFPHILSDDTVSQIVRDQDPDYYRFVKIPFMRYAYYNNYINFNAFQGAKYYIQDRKEAYHSKGFIPPQNIQWDYRFEEFVEKYPTGHVYKWNVQEIKYLKRIIDLTKNAGSTLILYESPVWVEMIPYMLNRNEIQDSVYKLAKKNNLEYWTFDTIAFTRDKSNFFSPLNTTAKGSSIFTKTLADCFNKTYYKKRN